MKKPLSRVQFIALDTNLFVYYLDSNSPFYSFAESLFRHIAVDKLQIITSILTLTELLSFNVKEEILVELEEELTMIPNLTLLDVNRRIAKEAARIRREYKFRLPDSIQLATALQSKAQAFISNDRKLKQFKELKIILLNEI